MLHKNSAFYIKKKKVFNKANMKKKRNMLSLLVISKAGCETNKDNHIFLYYR